MDQDHRDIRDKAHYRKGDICPLLRIADDTSTGHFGTGTAAGGRNGYAGFNFNATLATEPDNRFCCVRSRTAAKTDNHIRRKICICAMPFTTVWIVGSGVISLKILRRLLSGQRLMQRVNEW